MKVKGFLRVVFLVLLITSVLGLFANAQVVKKNYIIVANGQGPASTGFVNSFSSEIVANIEDIGVVLAASSDPNFAARVARIADVKYVSEDVELQWLDPKEKNLRAEELVPDAGNNPAANHESYSAIQWNLRQIRADQTAAMGIRGNGVVRARVAVLDAGIITKHPDIAPNLNLALSKSFVPTEPDLNPPANGSFNHGTHVAGIIAAPINSRGIQGVAPEAEIVAVKVLRASGSGSFSWMIQGLDYASGPAVHADIINMSLGALLDIKPSAPQANKGGWGTFLSALTRAVNLATQRGTLVISAAGNNGTNLNSSYGQVPAQSGNGMAVAAVGPIGWAINGDPGNWDFPASYTNYGQSVVDVAGPGGNDFLYGTIAGNKTCSINLFSNVYISNPCWVFDWVISPAAWVQTGPTTYSYYSSWAEGTSMATPHVAGVAALIVGQYGHMSPAQLKARLEQTGIDIWKPGADQFGKSRVDALNAVTMK